MQPSLTNFKGKVLQNEPLSQHTTFRIGGPADLLLIPSDLSDLKLALKLATDENLPLLVLGGGSNVLFSDEGFRGIVLKLSNPFDKVEIKDETVRAQAGVSLPKLFKITTEADLSGLEFTVGVPATLGGAVISNFGAFELSIKSLINSVTTINKKGEVQKRKKKEIDFGYRFCSLENEDIVITEVELCLSRRNPHAIREIINKNIEERKARQPLDYHCAGSIFKNPPGYSAGKLIDIAGLKGERVGDARVSEKHANFIVNLENASAKDVLSLIEKIRSRVKENSGIDLDLELKII